MTNGNIAPSFWIRLLPEHIDQNTDSFLTFLATRRANAEGDPAYGESLALLLERCAQIWSQITGSFPGTVDADTLRLGARLFGACALLDRDDDPEAARRAFCQMLLCLVLLVPAQATAITELISKAVTSKHITSTGFGWKNITGGDSPEVIATVILSGAEFTQEKIADRWFENESLGAVHVCDGRIEAWPVNRDSVRKTASVTTAFRDPLTGACVMSDTSSKMRTADKRDFAKLEVFIRDFSNESATLRRSPKAALKQYADGDTFPIRFLSVDRFGNMVVESADADHERVKGVIRNDMPAVKTYTTDDLTALMDKGDVFLAKWNRKASRFTLQYSLPEHMQKIIPVGSTITALCKGDNSYGRLMWFTKKGFPVTTRMLASYSQGDYALMSVEDVDEKGNVRAKILRHTDDTFVEDDARQDFLAGFSQATPDFREVPRKEDILTDGTQVGALARALLIVAQGEPDTMDRREMLLPALLLARCAGDTMAERYGKICLGHLRNLVAYMEDRAEMITPYAYDIDNLEGDCRKMLITAAMLRAYGTDIEPDPEDRVLSLAETPVQDERLARLRSLLKAEKQVKGIVPTAALASIRRTVLDLLNVSREDYEGMDVFGYLGPESGMQEYKSSFLIAPRDASEQNQQRTVFRVVDAFLNCETGGTLYLGVNDDGYVCGLEEDMRILERQDPRKKGMDGLLRHIRQRLEMAFPQEVYMTLSIRPVFDGRGVRIDVPSYPGGVVDMDGVAWIRFGSECIRMSDNLREKINARKQEKKD